MIKEKKWNVFATLLSISVPALIYVLFQAHYFNSLSPETISDVVNPIFFGMLSLIPTLIFLLFFSKNIFISWFRYIAWWVLLGVAYFIFFVSSENAGFLSPSHAQIVIFIMAILFVVTLVYAVCTKKLKKS
ncbi:MAG: hypothetical protein WAW13_04595 [Minisyncoccia bacterium]